MNRKNQLLVGVLAISAAIMAAFIVDRHASPIAMIGPASDQAPRTQEPPLHSIFVGTAEPSQECWALTAEGGDRYSLAIEEKYSRTLRISSGDRLKILGTALSEQENGAMHCFGGPVLLVQHVEPAR